MNSEHPSVNVLHADSSFVVADTKYKLTSSSVKGRILSISLPMMSILTVNELRSIISHEIAHYSGWDVDLSKRVLPVYSGITSTLSQINRGLNHSVVGL